MQQLRGRWLSGIDAGRPGC